jgi:hypothetical protein
LQPAVPTVFQDVSNPLLAQLAIFAKSLDYLEHHEYLDRKYHPNGHLPDGSKLPAEGGASS